MDSEISLSTGSLVLIRLAMWVFVYGVGVGSCIHLKNNHSVQATASAYK